MSNNDNSDISNDNGNIINNNINNNNSNNINNSIPISTTCTTPILSSNNTNETSSMLSNQMTIKEETNLIDTNSQIKIEDESSNSSPNQILMTTIKKEPIQCLTPNNSNTLGIIGSTNTGSMRLSNDIKNSNDEVTDGLLSSKDDMMTDASVGLPTLVGLTNIKKEEPGPDLTTDGFSSLGTSLNSTTNSNILGTGNITPMNIVSGGNNSMSNISRMTIGNSPDSIQQQGLLPTNIIGGGGVNTGNTIGTGIGNTLSGNGGTGGISIIKNQQQPPPQHQQSCGIGGGSGIGSSNLGGGMEYMQQQNHIFVFSTSLANKGAESVLSGQYSTIIAYHCAQPTTKKFLEDFFLKNPLKFSKMNRQNPGQWMNNMNIIGTKTSKGNNNSNNNVSNRNVNAQKLSTGTSSFGTNSGTDDLSTNDPELLPWEQTGSHLGLDPIGSNQGSNLNIPTNTDTVGLEVDSLVPDSPSLVSSGNNNVNNRSCSSHMAISSTSVSNVQQSPTIVTSNIGPTSPSMSGSLQPSLQGVKVPDENLTPQQRQHREEQLAKLKKMNQFLFPEQGSGMSTDFTGSNMAVDNEPVTGAPGPKMMGGPSNTNPGGVNIMGGLGTGNSPMSMTGGIGSMGPGMRGSNIMGGMGPRGGMCRPMGPMSLNAMSDNLLGNVPPNNTTINEITGMPCGMIMSGNQQGPNNAALMGSSSGPLGTLIPQQGVIPGGPLGSGGPINSCNMGNTMGGPMIGQNKNLIGGSGIAQMEWNKLQHQFYEEKKGKNLDNLGIGIGMCSSGITNIGGRQIQSNLRSSHQNNSRSQGPPPPYHQTPRSASVPIATQSPNPSSPTNPTSNLSLPSPRGGSTLNSPAGDHMTPGNVNTSSCSGPGNNNKQPSYKQDSPITGSCGGANNARTPLNHSSNPSTPISHLSPNASLKDLELGNPSSCGNTGKEPNLMPVPSPQQIQYLNTFEGQELTIQKQPNTTLKDGNIISTSGSNSVVGGGNSVSAGNILNQPGNEARLSGTSTPLTPSSIDRFPTSSGLVGTSGSSVVGSFPIPSSPQTPNPVSGNCSATGLPGDKNQRLTNSGPNSQGSRSSMSGDTPVTSNIIVSSVESMRFPPASPVMNFSPIGNQGGNQGAGNNQSNMKMGNFMDVSPNGKCPTPANDVSGGNFCLRADNLPLNPNNSCPPPAKPSHFDPISSLAQMSQQLTSNVSNAMNGQSGGGPGGGVMGGNPNVGMMGGFQNHGGMGMGGDMAGMSGHHVDSLMGGLDACGMGNVMPGMGQFGMHGNNNPNLSLGMMSGPGPRSLSPKLSGGIVGFPSGPVGIPHRMIGRPSMGGSPYNGANIQVKASTPNTIQYLPARPQVGNTNPRAPPSLDFLQRFANPISSMDGGNKVGTGQNINFYPNCNQMGQNGPGNLNMNSHIDGSGNIGGGDNGGMLNIGGMAPSGPMMGQNLMMRGLRPPGQGGNMVRLQGPPHMGNATGGTGAGAGGLHHHHHHHHHHPFSNGPPNGLNDPSMFPNNQMFAPGSKNSPMNVSIAGGPSGPGQNLPPQMTGGPGGAPDASQPLPPSMGGVGQSPVGGNATNVGGNFKSSQFVGPSTTDPNYAQQYHNFQQQLYATSTRSHMNNHPGAGALTGGPANPNQPFFVPK